MRNKFADAIFEIGSVNKNICALVADISPAGSMEKFRKKYPDRFINCGVAEQSMIGISAGLALKGMRPFCYTIATFALFRPFEFIRVDLGYQNLPVTVIGMGAGLIYSTLGGTHHSMEDIAIASSIPNMTVLAPCDPIEMKLATIWCATKSKGPVYMRLGKVGEPEITKDAYDKKFTIGKLRYIKKGEDIALISYGITINVLIEVSKELKNKQNINCSIINMHTIKPLDKKGLEKILKKYKKIIIVEEHVPYGSVSSMIKSYAYENKIFTDIKSVTLKDEFIHFYGSHKELLNKHGLSTSKIIKKINEK